MSRQRPTPVTPWLHRSSQWCKRYYKSTKSRFDRLNSLLARVADWYTKFFRVAIASLLLVVLTLLLISYISWKFQFWDVGSNSWRDRLRSDAWKFQRGATVVAQDQFGDQFSTVRYLWQGWKPADSMWFYTTTQGSDLLPYDFFMALEKPGTRELFRSNDNLNYYRYLPQQATLSNPDALPIGFVKDTYKGKDYVGFTCAACHTAQLNYNGIGIRIDGGGAGSDMDSFLQAMAEALSAALNDGATRARFVRKVMDRGHYSSQDDVVKDLQKYGQRLFMYNVVNHSETAYGYSRLDAFGRIFNRVLEHIITQKELKKLLNAVARDLLKQGTLTNADVDSIQQLQQRKGGVLSDEQRDHLFLRIAPALSLKAQLRLSQMIFNRPDAPTRYPFLWEHDYIQWNGPDSISNRGSIGRAACEVIGVFGTLDWAEEPRTEWSMSGLDIKATNISFNSSISVQNLRLIERQMEGLLPPQWPQDILSSINLERSSRGEMLFTTYCEPCHQRVDRSDPHRRIVERFSNVDDVGTDPKMANNAEDYYGLSGILKNQNVPTRAGNIFIGERAPAARLLTSATLNVLTTPTKGNVLSGGSDWLLDFAVRYFGEKVNLPIRKGAYAPDTTAEPLRSYEARSLNGIWATAPYLHNGSVPTLYDLLLPKKRVGDPDGEYRPDQFQVGSREFDPSKVGLKSDGYNGFLFDTSHRGNSNAGHTYGTGLDKEQRLDLLEYLKSL